MARWFLRLNWDTHESEVLRVESVPKDWDGQVVHARVWGLEDEPTPVTLSGERSRDGEGFFSVSVQTAGINAGFGFLAREVDQFPPSESEGQDLALSLLVSFIEKYGHADVPVDYVIGGFGLGRWVQNTRRSKGLSADLAERLNRIPEWNWE